MKLIFFVAGFRKNTGQMMSEGGSVDEMSGKKGHQFSLQRAMTKKRLSVFF